MAERMDLESRLIDIMKTNHVYYQPPETIKMKYPAIVYFLDDINHLYANDSKYKEDRSYTITLIDRNPESIYIDDILALPYCSFDRHFVTDNLNHFIFNIFW